MSVNIYDKSTDTLNKVAGVAKLDTWTGTQSEFDALDKSTLSDNCYINITDDLTGGKLYTWTGTRAEYEAEKDTIPDGCYVNITDDTDTYELNFPDGTGFYPDIKDGVRGYNTSETRGADTFFPFKGIATEYKALMNIFSKGVIYTTNYNVTGCTIGDYYLIIHLEIDNLRGKGGVIAGGSIIWQSSVLSTEQWSNTYAMCRVALVKATSSTIVLDNSGAQYSTLSKAIVFKVGTELIQ